MCNNLSLDLVYINANAKFCQNPSIHSHILSGNEMLTSIKVHNSITDKHYARQYMSNGMIHVQWSVVEFACVFNKFWLVESFFCIQGPAAADTSHTGNDFDQWDPRKHPVSWIVIGRKSFHWAMYLLLLNLPSKNQLSTNQNFFNTHTISQNDCWTCIIPLDMQNWCLTIPT